MTPTCFSLAPNLRCQTLTHLESALVIIPPALEIIFCVILCIIKRGSGDRRYFLLAGDGLLYFVLALFDVLAHVVVDNSFIAFKAFDITTGALSAGPLFLFTLYLTLLTTHEFQAILPRRIRWITKYTLFTCIPLVVISNAIGSFFSLRYARFPVRKGAPPAISIGFASPDTITFMDSLALVLLILMHAVAFLSSIARVVKIVLEKRRIEVAKNQDNEAAMINGLGWMAVGIKLGFVEAIIGFVDGSFATIIVRRGLRFLSRAFLIIGVVKGMDTVEDFTMFTVRGQRRLDARRSRAAALSGIFTPNPRRSFRPVSDRFDQESKIEPPASAISSESFTIQHVITPSPLIFATSLPGSASAALPMSHPIKRQPTVHSLESARSELSLYGKQVVVTYRHGRAPTLDLRRFSKLLVPLPETPESTEPKGPPRPATAQAMSRMPNPHSPPESPALSKPPRALSLPPSRSERSPLQDLTRLSVRPAPSPKDRNFEALQSEPMPLLPTPSVATGVGTESRYSTRTVASHASDSLEVVHALAMQFPGVPAWKLAAMRQERMSSAMTESDIMSRLGDISRSNSGRSVVSATGLVRRSSSVKRKPVPKLHDLEEEIEAENGDDAAVPTRRTRPQTYTAGESKSNSTSPASPSPMQRTKPRPVTHTPSASQPGASTSPRRRRGSASHSRSAGRSRSSSYSRGRPLDPAFEFPGKLGLADVMAQDQAELEAAWKQLGEKDKEVEKKARRPRASSIKSIGSVATRRTPTPSISSSSQRSSIVPEWHGVPDEAGSMSFPQAGIPQSVYRRDLKVSRFSADSSAYTASAIGRPV
ncbi:hypothetical protein BC629DRAFT_367491 [Irpex lacteus]|nr:hypothetical protein BC629DRAFT_367491 [Irpex lacteus]